MIEKIVLFFSAGLVVEALNLILCQKNGYIIFFLIASQYVVKFKKVVPFFKIGPYFDSKIDSIKSLFLLKMVLKSLFLVDLVVETLVVYEYDEPCYSSFLPLVTIEDGQSVDMTRIVKTV